jgi:hypothetical protein
MSQYLIERRKQKLGIVTTEKVKAIVKVKPIKKKKRK